MYNPAIAPFLDWMFVAGFVGVTLLVTWQIFTRNGQD